MKIKRCLHLYRPPRICAWVLFAIMGFAISVPADNLLQNPGFEIQGTTNSTASNWEWGNPDIHGGSWGTAGRQNWRSNSGSYEGAIAGSWAGGTSGGWWQEKPATPGKTYRASAWVWADATPPSNVWSAAQQGIRIEFYSGAANGQTLLSSYTNAFSTVSETWIAKSLTAVAPVGATWVRIVLFADGAGFPGALQFDDVSLELLSQQTRYVSGSGSATFPYTNWSSAAHSIQTAIDAALEGETVVVASGVYPITSEIVVSKGLYLHSAAGANSTRVVANGSSRCFHMQHHDAVLDGFTITGGSAEWGGGVSVLYGATVDNCNITGNVAIVNGGGVDIDTDGTIRNCNIVNNSSGNGGGVNLNHGGVVQGCNIFGNQATNSGGAVELTWGGLLENSYVISNTALYGAVHFSYDGGIARNCLIRDNVGVYGGGVHLYAGGDLINCTIVHNTASQEGGGVYSLSFLYYNTHFWPNLLNNVIWDNYAIYWWDVYWTVPSNFKNNYYIAADPLFTDYLNRDYSLASNSPCIDAGYSFIDPTPTLYGLYGATDLDGNPRIVSGTIDIGAYEKQGNTPVVVTGQPHNTIVAAGSSATFSVSASGSGKLCYQWRKDNSNISGATNATLLLNSVQVSDDGNYSVLVGNFIGSVVSASASLAVVAVDTSSQPAQVVTPTPDPKPPTKDSLIVVTHGFIPALGPDVMPSWVNDLYNAIQAHAPANYAVTYLDWSDVAYGINPETAVVEGNLRGQLYGVKLNQMGWQHIHLIGHSAGAAVIEGIAKHISGATTVHETFLDPFVGYLTEWKGQYGANADWSDCYFTQDGTGGYTGGNLGYAYNVDVDWVNPGRDVLSFRSSLVAFSSHEYSHDFYLQTVTNTDANWCAKNYGFQLSKEGGGWINNTVNYPVGNGANPPVPCGLPGAIASPNYPLTVAEIKIQTLVHAISDVGASIVGSSFSLSTLPFLLQSQQRSGGLQPLDNGPVNGTNGPAWLAVGITVTSKINFVSFDAAFTDTNAAEGLLTVYWNTNQIGMVDERVASTNLQSYRFPLPNTVTDDVYTLGFRLDVFTNAASSIMVTNVATGYSGLTNISALGVASGGAGGQPAMTLSGDAGYNYLVQASTNLSAWTPLTLLPNSNGTVQFTEPTSTNFNLRFYRAISP